MQWINFLFFLLISLPSIAQSYVVNPNDIVLDGKGNYAQVQPGDTLLLSGSRTKIILQNFVGTAEKPIVFTNLPHEVFRVHSDISYGVSVQLSQHIKIVGQQVNGKHGIQVSVPNGVGIGIGYLSQYWELNGVEIGPTKGPGLLAKTDPNCQYSATRDQFTQHGGKVRYNYIHDTGTEGIYYGSSAYGGYKLRCNGTQTTVLPHIIIEGEIAYNIVKNAGWDGIQVASALNTPIHHNTIINDSQEKQGFHMNGIIAGLGYSGHIYNNLIVNGNGNGIFSMAKDSLIIENNVILNPGYALAEGTGRYGIFLNLENEEAKWLQVNNNLIANPRYQAFHATLGENITHAYLLNNLISYNDSLTGSLNELVSIPIGVLDLNAGNHTNEWSQLEKYYWKNDSLDQRKNGFTTDKGIAPPVLHPYDFYNRPRLDHSERIDIGPYEFHETTSGIDSNSFTNIDCSSIDLAISKQQQLPEGTYIFDLSGKEFAPKIWKKLPEGHYVIVNPGLQCTQVYFKN